MHSRRPWSAAPSDPWYAGMLAQCMPSVPPCTTLPSLFPVDWMGRSECAAALPGRPCWSWPHQIATCSLLGGRPTGPCCLLWEQVREAYSCAWKHPCKMIRWFKTGCPGKRKTCPSGLAALRKDQPCSCLACMSWIFCC